MNAEINKEFIFKYLSGKSSALQKQLVDDWVKIQANEELFYAWLVEYEYQNPQYLTDLTGALASFNGEADLFDSNPTLVSNRKETQVIHKKPMWVWMVAASLFFGLVVCGLFFKEAVLNIKYESAYGQSLSLQLEDGTKVIMNPNSTLQVPRFGFGNSTREVHLVGEASFSVTHLANNQKFVVKTGKELEVVVLGTEFTVYARQQKARVALNKGKVQLNYHSGLERKQLTMKPGEMVTLDQDNQLTKENVEIPEKFEALHENHFEFDETTLSEFAELMNENYGLNVIVRDESLANRTLVGSYSAESPEELLDMVSRVFNLKIKKEGDSLVLTNKMNIP